MTKISKTDNVQQKQSSEMKTLNAQASKEKQVSAWNNVKPGLLPDASLDGFVRETSKVDDVKQTDKSTATSSKAILKQAQEKHQETINFLVDRFGSSITRYAYGRTVDETKTKIEHRNSHKIIKKYDKDGKLICEEKHYDPVLFFNKEGHLKPEQIRHDEVRYYDIDEKLYSHKEGNVTTFYNEDGNKTYSCNGSVVKLYDENGELLETFSRFNNIAFSDQGVVNSIHLDGFSYHMEGGNINVEYNPTDQVDSIQSIMFDMNGNLKEINFNGDLLPDGSYINKNISADGTTTFYRDPSIDVTGSAYKQKVVSPDGTITEEERGITIRHGESEYVYNLEGDYLTIIKRDSKGNVSRVTDESYDAFNNVIKQVKKDANGNVISNIEAEYEGEQMLKRVDKDAQGNVLKSAEFLYDKNGELAKEVFRNADGKRISFKKWQKL